MADTPDEGDALPPQLRFLRTLVTILTASMILGVITIVALLVIRLNDDGRAILVHPELFEIPAGVGTVGYSILGDRTIIIGDDAVIRVFDTQTQAPLRNIDLNE